MEVKGWEQLSRQFLMLKSYVLNHNAPPILAVHCTEDHESGAEPFPVEPVQMKNLMTIEQIPRLSTGQKGRELACSQLMEVENGNSSAWKFPRGCESAYRISQSGSRNMKFKSTSRLLD